MAVTLLQFLLAFLFITVPWSIALRVWRGYQDYLSLGPGGTPSNFAGYLKVTFLGLFSLRDPYQAPFVPETLHSSSGYLKDLPKRPYPRPVTKGIAPQRQVTQRAGPDLYAKLAAAIEHLVVISGKRFRLGTSCFEKHGVGFFSVAQPRHQTCNGEICHAHYSDGSLHLTLHPADIKIALESGWAERHPLARGGVFARFVPLGFIMVYAPQTEEDIATIMQIVVAAAKFICGEDEEQFAEFCPPLELVTPGEVTQYPMGSDQQGLLYVNPAGTKLQAIEKLDLVNAFSGANMA